MTREQFLNTMGEIDDKFLKEIAHTSDEEFDWDPDSEKPQIIRLEHRPFPLWKTAAVTAASVCILAAGFIGGIKLHNIQSAGSSPEISLSSSDSYTSIADDPYSEFKGHKFNIELSGPDTDVIHTDPVIMTDDSSFAELRITFKNTSEHFTMHIMVDRKDHYDVYDEGKYKLTRLGEIIVSENKDGAYFVDYTENAAPGDELVLGFYTSNDQIDIEGKWLP